MNCGLPSQRWYHVPRSFLNNDVNTLVLFEEMGGNPEQVAFQTVTIGTVCGIGNEGSRLELSCQGGDSSQRSNFPAMGTLKLSVVPSRRALGNLLVASLWLKGLALEESHAPLMSLVQHLDQTTFRESLQYKLFANRKYINVQKSNLVQLFF
ncbi:Beta-galactosidase [Quillaja saponaria]|uniref:Beta-galactosidase n=1 Tax=Quillaja saponaria TaxID=32244 RepID=A0AAD7LRA7_QUISA|nr:Beta-galactosidase [Quillaja saponaria]